MVPHWVRGGKDEATAFYLKSPANTTSSKKLDVLALGNSIRSLEPLRADVLEVKDYDELEGKEGFCKRQYRIL